MKKKIVKSDGLGPHEIKQIRSAVRLVWQRSHARALVAKRCVGADGFSYCEMCKEKTPKLRIDHILRVGDLDSGYIPRMFVPSTQLQGLCSKCHNEKTKAEKKAAKGKK